MKNAFRLRSKKGEQGFTLLEYCAGAAVIIGIVWATVDAMGTSMGSVFTSVKNWSDDRAKMIDNGNLIGKPS